MTFAVYYVVDACNTQKFGKAVGMDGVAMEAFIDGGARLRAVSYTHLTLPTIYSV